VLSECRPLILVKKYRISARTADGREQVREIGGDKGTAAVPAKTPHREERDDTFPTADR
jgi:hypothetical protein